VSVTPFPPCNYWVHVTTYVCEPTSYLNLQCCYYIYCSAGWTAVSDGNGVPGVSGNPGAMSYAAGEMYTGDGDCLGGTLWTCLIPSGLTSELPGAASYVGDGTDPDKYFSICSNSNPSTSTVHFYNRSADQLAVILGYPFTRVGPDPNCCLPPGNLPYGALVYDSSNPSSNPPGEAEDTSTPCDGFDAPTYTGYPGEVVFRCKCAELTDPPPCYDLLWHIALSESTTPPPDSTYIGYIDTSPNATAVYASCSERQPDNYSGHAWTVDTPEAIASGLSAAFHRSDDDPLCCLGDGGTTTTAAPCDFKLWTIVVADGTPAPGDSTHVGYRDSSRYPEDYYAKCAETQPPDYLGSVWTNETAEEIAWRMHEPFTRIAPDPDCCTGGPGS
jgi:hypothetical protein